MGDFRRPVKFDDSGFDAFAGGADPAVVSTVAHETAALLLTRARESSDEATIQRLIHYTDDHGIEEIAELWSQSDAGSLPGVLWRMYLLRAFIRQNPQEVSYLFHDGSRVDATIHPIVAGVESPAGPEEIVFTADEILRGVFQDDFAIALERAASFCTIVADGCTTQADAADFINELRAKTLTRRALRLTGMAEAFVLGAGLWRKDALD